MWKYKKENAIWSKLNGKWVLFQKQGMILNNQLPTTYNKLTMGMGAGSLKGGSQEVAKPNVQLKMEDVYIFWKVMEILW
jgi:hypothetical protein